MIALIDMGLGNLSSAKSGFARAGADAVIVSSREAFNALMAEQVVTGVVLPGVGSFGDAMFQLRATGLLAVVRQVARAGMPLFGICLGMQLLFGHSEEHGSHVGLGFLPGHVVRFRDTTVKIPHMGWNSLDVVKPHPLLVGVTEADYVYFVHSYYAVVEQPETLLAATTYASVTVPAVVGKGAVFGAQFHPEKSGRVGEQILRNFVEFCALQQAPKEARA